MNRNLTRTLADHSPLVIASAVVATVPIGCMSYSSRWLTEVFALRGVHIDSWVFPAIGAVSFGVVLATFALWLGVDETEVRLAPPVSTLLSAIHAAAGAVVAVLFAGLAIYAFDLASTPNTKGLAEGVSAPAPVFSAGQLALAGGVILGAALYGLVTYGPIFRTVTTTAETVR